MNKQLTFLFAITILSLSIATPVLAENLFPKDSVTAKEMKEIKDRGKKAEKLLEVVRALQLFQTYDDFKKGKCEELIDIEGEAKGGSSYHQWLMSDIYHLGL